MLNSMPLKIGSASAIIWCVSDTSTMTLYAETLRFAICDGRDSDKSVVSADIQSDIR